MSNKIFEEALADAKKLKEVAEENAKKAILEAVTPRIREFIEDQLLENENEGEACEADEPEQTEEADEEIVLDESSISALISMLGGGDLLDSLNEGREVLDASVDDVLSRMNSSEKKKIFNLVNKINENADKLSADSINSNNIQEKNQMKKEKFYEVDLKALRESIEEEMGEGSYMEEMDHDVSEKDEYGIDEEMDDKALEEMLSEIKLMIDLGEDIEEDQIPEELRAMLVDEEEGEEPLELDDEESSEEESEDMGEELPELPDMAGDAEPMADLQEVFEVDPRMLRQELARVRRQLQEGKVDHQFGGKGEGKAGVDGSYGGKGKSNAGVKGAFGGGKEGQDAFTNPPQINKLNEAIRNLRRKNRAQAEKLDKYRSAVVTLREQLEDLNLFNAKLLYVNKILNSGKLTESQKKSVIKALDEARSLDETKSLYKSLTETLASSKQSLTESKRYGSSSKTTRSSGKVLSESAGEVSRWQKLAGLK